MTSLAKFVSESHLPIVSIATCTSSLPYDQSGIVRFCRRRIKLVDAEMARFLAKVKPLQWHVIMWENS